MKTYPPDFADKFGCPFPANSRIGFLIAHADSTFEDFVADPVNWTSETGLKYTEAKMQGHWQMIEAQKARLAAWWLVHTGAYPAYDTARRAVS